MLPFNYRYVIIGLFGAATVLAASLGSSHSALSSLISKCFSNSNPTIAYLISISGVMGELFVLFPSNWLLEKIKMRKMVTICSGVVMVGTFLKTLVSVSVIFVILGHFMTVGVFVFYTNGSTKLSAIWFNARERTMATSLILGANFIGFSLGFLINAIQFNSSDDNDTSINIELFKEKISLNFKIMFIISVVLFLLILLFFKEGPENKEDKEEEAPTKLTFMESLQNLIRDPAYIKIALNFALADTNFNLMVYLLQIILARFGVDNTTIYLSGFVMNISCAASFVTYGFILTNYLTLKQGVEYGTISNVFSIAILFLLIFTKNRYFIIFGSILYGFTYNIYCAPSAELATEQTFPGPEEQAVGVLMFSSIVLGIVFSFIIEQIIEAGFKDIYIVGLIIGIYVMAYLAIKSADTKLKRSLFFGNIKVKKDEDKKENEGLEMNMIDE